MDIILNKKSLVVFDLDDTLYNEFDYLNSAFREIAEVINSYNISDIHDEMIGWYKEGKDVFENIIKKYSPDLSKAQIIRKYREHMPNVKLFDDAQKFIDKLAGYNIKMALVTDGRSITQRNKISALGLENIFEKVVISEEINSEKPSSKNFEILIDENYNSYVYIADNPKKDFFAPNKLGWETICLLNNGKNIHKQDFQQMDLFIPKNKISSFKDINIIYEQ